MENGSGFPPGFEGMERILQKARAEIARIDAQLSKLTKDKGPQNRLSPPGYGVSRKGNPDRLRSTLEFKKERIKTMTIGAMRKAATNKDPKVSGKIMENAVEEFYPNPFKKLDKEGLKKAEPKPKSLEVSTQFAQRRLAVERAEKAKEVADKTKTEDKGAGRGYGSMSAKFTQSLGYTKTLVNTKLSNEVDKSIKVNPVEVFNKNRTDLTKKTEVYNMSSRFKHPLGYLSLKPNVSEVIAGGKRGRDR